LASKRMFDKAIIDTDKFADMPLTTKALYFLLGMEADDKGFVSPRRVMRAQGGTEDDLKILIAKGYVIYFESGVIVITDWHRNNWLDTRRIKETEFLNELSLLSISDERYVLKSDKTCSASAQHPLSIRSASAKQPKNEKPPKPLIQACLANAKQMLSENRIEQYRTEENSIEQKRTEQKKDDEMENEIEKSKTFEDEFRELWDLYPPKKRNMQDCFMHYKVHRKKFSFEEVKSGLIHLNDYIAKKQPEMQYVKNSFTWFSKAGWTDVFDLNEKKPKYQKVEPTPDWLNGTQQTSSSDIEAVKRINEMKKKFGVGLHEP